MAMSDQKLTKKELNTISWRYILASQLNWNYERMMSSGYLYGILPVLKNSMATMKPSCKICCGPTINFSIPMRSLGT